jgi:predicted amidohydrolase
MLTYAVVAGAAVLAAAVVGTAQAADAPQDLVVAGDFTALGKAADLPAPWKTWAPLWSHAAVTVKPTAEGLLMESPQEPYGVGGVTQTLAGVKGGQAYLVQAEARTRGIASPLRSLMVRLTWTKGGKPLHPAGCMVRLKVAYGGMTTSEREPGRPMIHEADTAAFEDVLVAPADADGATLSLEVKWPQQGSVTWRRAGVLPTAAPPPRKVKVGTVYLRPKNSTPEKNMDLWCAKIDEAGRLGLDIVCLGEAILQVGTNKDVGALAEAIPGPSTERLGAAAKRNRLWVVAGLTERQGERVYNTAVLLDREGRLAGTYRKIHLPREEWRKGITPGTEYPVYKTDFGTIAIQICYDWFFPETAEVFALRGAEILFAPTWGSTFPDADGRAEGETVFRVRARDNGLYLVPCVYDGSSMVIDPLGRILASNKGAEGVFWAEVDLAAREPLWWVGQWRQIGPRDRMPETYRPLTDHR